MAIGTGGTKKGIHDINVTPLIDVLLVLLIIFMTITPITPRGVDALVPKPPMNDQITPEKTIVIQIVHRPGGIAPGYRINGTEVSRGELQPKLAAIFATRAERVAFIKGDSDLNFADVAEVIDVAHSANVDHIGLMTPKVEAGQ
jgi:biopolymer transport protein TolR